MAVVLKRSVCLSVCHRRSVLCRWARYFWHTIQDHRVLWPS